MRNLALIGLGPHAKRVYCRFIKSQKDLNLYVVVELESKRRDVEDFFQEKPPPHILYVPDKEQVSPKEIDSELKKRLDKLRIDYAIIATEPKAHGVYLDYFISRQIPCLTDKPVIALEGLTYLKNIPDRQYRQIEELEKKCYTQNTRILVQTQRREHPAYQFIFNEATKIIKEYGVPITYFHIYHSDGTWSMPEEYYVRENHPYKYGYGKLMHSGYHFVDLVAWIAEINQTSEIKTETRFTLPDQHYGQISGKNLYQKLFNKKTALFKDKRLGEVDCFSSIALFKDKTFTTYGTVDLLQSGFSKRAWYDLPKDTYKGNGRLRHETLNLQLGPLCDIQLHTYQSNEIGKANLFGVGGEEHLDVYIFRNSKLIGGKDFELINFGEKIRNQNLGEAYIGQNELSRYIIFKQLVNGTPSNVTLKKQLLTNKLLSAFYKSGQKRKPVSIYV